MSVLLKNNINLYPTSIINTGKNTDSLANGFILASPIPTTINSNPYVTTLPIFQDSLPSANPYNHTANLVNTNDLQLCNGSFRTKSTSFGYLNYGGYTGTMGAAGPNYSSISSSSYRIATYVWKCPNDGNQYTKVIFKINGIDTDISINDVNDSNNQPTIGATPIYIYYLIQDRNNIETFSNSLLNTTWININIYGSDFITANNYFYTTMVVGGKNTSATNTYTDGTYTLYGNIPTSKFSDNSFLYFRLALPMNQTFNFTSVTASFYNP